MARIIIACATLRRELNMLMEKHGCADPVLWLEAGDHNRPQKRREAIETALRKCSEYDTALLAMSFCGNALDGLDSGEKTLLLPCFDDCIGLLLDGLRAPDTYYLTDGWLDGENNILKEYTTSLLKYGEEKTKRIFSAMLRGYRFLAWVDTGCATETGFRRAKEAATLLNLEFLVVAGTLSRLEDLLFQQECTHILRIPPHTAITLAMRHGMIPVTVQGQDRAIYALPGENLLQLLRRYGLAPAAPCGGHGTCGKCTVYIDELPQRACQIMITAPLSVRVPQKARLHVLHGDAAGSAGCSHPAAAADIGTTSVVCSVLDGETGERLAVKGASNPQSVYGADVVTRIRAARSGSMVQLTALIRNKVDNLLLECCAEANIAPEEMERICIVGNPAMEQLFLGISPDNLVEIPFHPVLTEAKSTPAVNYLPHFPNGQLLVIPNISAYVGSDTIGCILAEHLQETQRLTLLVDIGTNGEMVLAGRNRMVACATAAGPALEGAGIRFGMSACDGAIDHVWLEENEIRFSVIGNCKPAGICGSGLIDAVAVFLELGKINARGRIAPDMEWDGQRILPVCDGIFLTQEDIRAVQMAKGAIHGGIRLMLDHMDVSAEEIDSCLLAGAFGNYLNPDSACRIGLIPPELSHKIRSVGNGAARGAEQMALDDAMFLKSQDIAGATEILELASLPDFPKIYAKSMNF